VVNILRRLCQKLDKPVSYPDAYPPLKCSRGASVRDTFSLPERLSGDTLSYCVAIVSPISNQRVALGTTADVLARRRHTGCVTGCLIAELAAGSRRSNLAACSSVSGAALPGLARGLLEARRRGVWSPPPPASERAKVSPSVPDDIPPILSGGGGLIAAFMAATAAAIPMTSAGLFQQQHTPTAVPGPVWTRPWPLKRLSPVSPWREHPVWTTRESGSPYSMTVMFLSLTMFLA